jgi:hypothetical protein
MSKGGPQRVELTRWEQPLPAYSAYGRILAFSARIVADREGRKGSDLTRSPSRRRKSGICAFLPLDRESPRGPLYAF